MAMGELEKRSIKELKERAIGLCDVIYNVECFGTHDLIEYEAILAELERRGYEVQEQRVLRIKKVRA